MEATTGVLCNSCTTKNKSQNQDLTSPSQHVNGSLTFSSMDFNGRLKGFKMQKPPANNNITDLHLLFLNALS